jgi:trehalose 6-phosphate synthase
LSVNVDREADLPHKCADLFGGGRLVIASNRGPLEYEEMADGQGLTYRIGSGGLVAALLASARLADVTWVATAMTEADRHVAASGGPAPKDGRAVGCQVRFVAPDRRAYHLHYNVFSNPILWFLHHSMLDGLRRRDLWDQMEKAWGKGYVPVNRAFADAVVEELRRPGSAGVALLQDYHLYLAGRYVRDRAPDAVLQHFVHVPWPEPHAWLDIPWYITQAICDGLLANDVVRFQTRKFARNFLLTCLDHVRGAFVDFEKAVVSYEGRRTRVRSGAISVDPRYLQGKAASAEAQGYLKKLGPLAGEHTIVRVDRVDPSKNVLGGFQAFDLLLRRHPELRGRVKFLAFLVPSRTGIPEYRRYAEQVFRLIDCINARYGDKSWRPIEVFYENNFEQALAGMTLYDVLLVNSLADGMNLVAKEGPMVNQRDGVLVLSTRAGAFQELGDSALAVNPEDVRGTAEALWQALGMPASERRRRASLLRAAITERPLLTWMSEQLEELHEVAVGGAAEPALVGVGASFAREAVA